MSDLRPGDRLAVRGAEQVEGRVLQVDRDGLLADWGGQVGTHRHLWSDVDVRFIRLPRPNGGRNPRSREAS